VSLGVGDSESGGTSTDDDGYYRAVIVRVYINVRKGLQIVPFSEGPPGLLISSNKDNPAKSDLISTPSSVSGMSIVVRTRVFVARKERTKDLEMEMMGELTTPDLFSGTSVGLQSFNDFKSNPVAGATIDRPVGSELSNLVDASPEFQAAHDEVEKFMTDALQASAFTGVLDYHVLAEPKKAVPPPSISYRGLQSLHVYIGSFQGVDVWMESFSADEKTGRYESLLRYEWIDHFGIDDTDLAMDTSAHGSPGQVSFWVLQRERHPGHMPYRVRVIVKRKATGKFASSPP
jgi:hypothetical protein